MARLLKECGKANAKVVVLRDPAVSGYEDACGKLPEIRQAYRRYDLLLFLPDADGKDRSQRFAQFEAEAGPKLICCAAVEEVEAWLLAGHLDKLDQPWPIVRADTSVKESIFAPFLREHGSRRPGGGREELMQQTLSNLRGLLERCPELARLQERICAALA
ncbi:MAG: hypothetical protein WDO73_14950 [Ignavibacteriota bacterium]